MLYIDVIVPLPLQGVFTYSVPDSLADQIDIGCRVIVQFGKKKYYTAIIHRIHEDKKLETEIKEIISVLDKYPIVLPEQLQFWEWIASYYMCTLGEVSKAALPAALKLESETHVFLDPEFESQVSFTPNEEKIFYILSDTKPLRISEIEKITHISNAIPYVKSLVDKGAAYISERVKNKYSAKTETAYRLAKDFSDEELSQILDELKRAKKQLQLLYIFLELRHEAGNPPDFYILKKQLMDEAAVTAAVLDSLEEKGILNSFRFEVGRFNSIDATLKPIKDLTPDQSKAYNETNHAFTDKQVVLLHGITSSGKTEIYIRLIQDAIDRGEQVLYLLPEISLTAQMTDRLKSVFGNQLMVYHSKFNDNERAEIWQSLLTKDDCKIVLGARSAIFLPFRKLGLIIVDEEHESSFKQQDPAPRYNAKNASIVLAANFGAKVLLGTATPSIETYYNALEGRFGLVTLSKRYAEIELPEVVPVNTKDLRRRKIMKTILSPPLLDEMKEALSRKEQVILFQNRRGFAPLLECKTCSWTPKCEHCDVSLTYHKGQRVMICHYCGAVYSVPSQCPECQTPTLDVQGYGTERIEELVTEQLPEANVVRMDLDTTRSKRAYERIIADFELNITNVLIGTQMVSKGLDFDNVSVVGILNADSMLNYPDFRAHERAFQLMTQVSGRAGRKNKRGLVLLQTAHPGHPIISFIRNNDYAGFYETQINERQLFRYPPFYRLIEIVLKAKDESLVDSMAGEFGRILRQTFNDRVLGPVKPTVARIQSLYIRKILLKIENQASPSKVREMIDLCHKYVLQNSKYKSVLLYYDVDPM
ncbi:replication restart helicase PriA [Dysgonomonas macrotermitis]|uniref:Replication restart protein PriA n=1 Tax=Dysgonomonas macrotermitis TaxID=1346286 RepID=A0A1M5GHG0_9BACT|nr:primosomal protein N' [Dysgonomonas macrotermitis]SHG02941.1 replication restart DNA helicase PriA [Dysgonomonas macrotermitis]